MAYQYHLPVVLLVGKANDSGKVIHYLLPAVVIGKVTGYYRLFAVPPVVGYVHRYSLPGKKVCQRLVAPDVLTMP